jgi:2Fe-2S ferredoxin
MQAARLAAVPGIDAECGGNGACGTCHVYVEPRWLARLPAIGADERDLLAIAPHATACSRLSCQLRLSRRLDGLEVRVPDRQR